MGNLVCSVISQGSGSCDLDSSCLPFAGRGKSWTMKIGFFTRSGTEMGT